MAETNTVNLRNQTVDVSRVRRVIANEGAKTHTLVFDSVHDDTDPTGKLLEGGAVGDHPREMPETLNVKVTIGNRATYSDAELSESGFFDVYNRLHVGKSIGPKKTAPEKGAGEPAK